MKWLFCVESFFVQFDLIFESSKYAKLIFVQSILISLNKVCVCFKMIFFSFSHETFVSIEMCFFYRIWNICFFLNLLRMWIYKRVIIFFVWIRFFVFDRFWKKNLLFVFLRITSFDARVRFFVLMFNVFALYIYFFIFIWLIIWRTFFTYYE